MEGRRGGEKLRGCSLVQNQKLSHFYSKYTNTENKKYVQILSLQRYRDVRLQTCRLAEKGLKISCILFSFRWSLQLFQQALALLETAVRVTPHILLRSFLF